LNGEHVKRVASFALHLTALNVAYLQQDQGEFLQAALHSAMNFAQYAYHLQHTPVPVLLMLIYYQEGL